jgi:hypothetical protein
MHRPGFDGDDLPGRGCVHRCTERSTGFRNQLPLEDVIADDDDRLCRIAGMLCNRQYQLFW